MVGGRQRAQVQAARGCTLALSMLPHTCVPLVAPAPIPAAAKGQCLLLVGRRQRCLGPGLGVRSVVTQLREGSPPPPTPGRQRTFAQ